MGKTSATAILVLQRAGGVIGLMLNALGAVQSSHDVKSAWVWVVAGTVLLVLSFGSVLVQQHYELDGLRQQPRPNIVFERSRPADGTVAKLGTAQLHDAYFIRAEFENRRRPSPPTTSLERPHVRIRYYQDQETDGIPFALVRDGRIAEAPERVSLAYPENMKNASEVALNEIRVGRSMTVDLLVRVKGMSVARTWSDEGGNIGQTGFTPGTYIAVVEIEGDNLTDTVVQRLRIILPDDASEIPTLEPVTPR
jgi:hypothetical protein